MVNTFTYMQSRKPDTCSMQGHAAALHASNMHYFNTETIFQSKRYTTHVNKLAKFSPV